MRTYINKTILILILFSVKVVVGQKYQDHGWMKAKPHTTIPDSLKGEDAIMIYQYQFIYNDIVDDMIGTVSSNRTVMRKIKILTDKGLNEYSKVFLNLYPEERVIVLDARTIKPNGKVIDFKAKDIKKIDFKSPYYNDTRYQQLRFLIPGVEVGDEVEIIYKVKSNQLNTGDDIFLHTYLPCIASSFTYSSSTPFVNEIKVYNGMPQYTEHKGEKNTVLSWSLTNLPSIGEQNQAIYTNQVPYIRFVIRQYKSQYSTTDITKNNWNEIYKLYSTSYNNNEGLGAVKKSYLKEFVDDFKSKFPNKKNEDLFAEIHQFIYDSVTVKQLEENDSKRAMGFYLYNRYINHYNLHLLYKELFILLDIKFYVCFGRDKYEGILDRNFVAPHIINHIFYAYYNGSQLNFIYPYYSYQKYFMNELPASISGTGIMLLSKGSPNSIFCETKELLIPSNSPEINYKLKKINIQIDNLKDSTFKSNSNTTLSGVYSTFYRQSHNDDLEKKEYKFYSEMLFDKEIETESLNIINQSNIFPFNYTLSAQHKTPITFTQIDENVFTLKLSDLLNISTLYSSEKKRYLEYHTRYLYNDISSIVLSFKNNVTIENLAVFKNLSLSNDFGSVTIDVSQKDEKTIVLYVSYQIKKDKLLPEEYIQLININEALENILSQSISFTKRD